MVRVVGNLAVFGAGWVVFVVIGDSWWQLVMAVFFAFMFTQLAFLGPAPTQPVAGKPAQPLATLSG